MSVAALPASYFIGWDVGAWHCDTNSKSRDAIVILDEALNIVGAPWRGNLRESINAAANAAEWLESWRDDENDFRQGYH